MIDIAPTPSVPPFETHSQHLHLDHQSLHFHLDCLFFGLLSIHAVALRGNAE